MSDATVKASVRLITPDQARRLLANPAVKNRAISKAHMMWIAEQIASGTFYMTGEPIILDKEGKLLDGQHRLEACVYVREPIRVVVVRGIDKRAFRYMGVTKSRTIRDVLEIAGYGGYSASMSSALGWLYLCNDTSMLNTPRATGFTADIALDLLEQNPGLDKCVAKRHTNPWMDLKMRSGVAVIWYLYQRTHRKKINAFFERVTKTAKLRKADPANVLRNYYAADAAAEKRDRAIAMLAKTVLAARADIEGRMVRKLLWVRGEDFPALLSSGRSHGERDIKTKAARG